jgi:uncharacterized membrane protein YjgN (DUF898 family)
LAVDHTGQRRPLFGLAFRTGLPTVLTQGNYRFWGKTRIRQYIWSSARVGEDTLEFTGTGPEKFLGFLVATINRCWSGPLTDFARRPIHRTRRV